MPARRDLPFGGDPADEFHSPYCYVENDPVNFVDPDGMNSEKPVNSGNPIEMPEIVVTADAPTVEEMASVGVTPGMSQEERLRIINELDKNRDIWTFGVGGDAALFYFGININLYATLSTVPGYHNGIFMSLGKSEGVGASCGAYGMWQKGESKSTLIVGCPPYRVGAALPMDDKKYIIGGGATVGVGGGIIRDYTSKKYDIGKQLQYPIMFTAGGQFFMREQWISPYDR